LRYKDLNISIGIQPWYVLAYSALLFTAASARSPRYQCYHSRDDARAGE